MPIISDKYISPTWVNDGPPAINAEEMNDITKTLEALDACCDDVVDAAISAYAIGGSAAISVDDGAGGIPVKEFSANFTPYQSGTGAASPDNPRTIIAAESISASITGKNLFDGETASFEPGYINATGGITSSAPYSYCAAYVPVAPGTDYCFSGKLVTPGSASAVNSVAYYDDDKNFISRYVPDFGVPAQFHTPNNCRYIRFNVTRAYYDPSTIQLEAGTSPTAYAAYSGGLYTADLSGTGKSIFGGTWNAIAGTVTPTWRRTVEDGTMDVADGGLQPNGYCIIFTDVADVDPNNRENTLCDRRTYAARQVQFLTAEQFTWRTNTSGDLELCIIVPGATSFDDACYALVETPVTFVYPLASPASALNVTPVQMNTQTGLNNIWTSGDRVHILYRRDATIVISRLDAQIASMASQISALDARVTALEQRG